MQKIFNGFQPNTFFCKKPHLQYLIGFWICFFMKIPLSKHIRPKRFKENYQLNITSLESNDQSFVSLTGKMSKLICKTIFNHLSTKNFYTSCNFITFLYLFDQINRFVRLSIRFWGKLVWGRNLCGIAQKWSKSTFFQMKLAFFHKMVNTQMIKAISFL